MTAISRQEIHVGDVGTVFRITVYDGAAVVDLSDSTDLLLVLKKPDGTTLERELEFTTDGTDGKVEYVLESGDMDAAGAWSGQVKVTFTEGQWWSNIVKFTVRQNLQ